MVAGLIRGSLAVLVVLAMVSVVTIVAGGDPVSAQAVNSFTDDDGNIHEANIEFIAAAGSHHRLWPVAVLPVSQRYARPDGCISQAGPQSSGDGDRLLHR